MDPVWQEQAQAKLKNMPKKALELRERALNDLNFFARLVNPGRLYGQIHTDVFRWLENYSLFKGEEEQAQNKLLMLPRGHQKSHAIATCCAWLIARHPEITILYVSATAELAEMQLFDVQNILTGPHFTKYFPEYVHPQEGKRTKWSTTAFMVDHPKRDVEGVRDATVRTAGLTTNTTGWHADIIVADDLVVPENAYTEGGRDQVVKKASQFTSIRNAGGFTLACGTRYHPSDVYSKWKEQVYDVYSDSGELIERRPVWDIIEFAVETDGVFLWPKGMREDGKAFGFDKQVLARIYGEFEDKTQFVAQYYNNPNDASTNRIDRSKFQYYNQKLLNLKEGRWYFNDKRLNVYAAIDFAYSLNKRADWTAIVVIGMDCDKNIFVLDIDRFKADKTSEYFKHIKELHSKWRFNKLRAEITAAQSVIVNAIKDYLKEDGLTLPIDECRPTKKKEERIAAAIEPLYSSGRVWHFEGGWTKVLEEEVVLARPANDDVVDAFAAAVEIATPPAQRSTDKMKDFLTTTVKTRFGGLR